MDAVPRGRCRGRRGRRLGGAADRTRRHACPGPRADCGVRRRPRGHGTGAAFRGAGGHRGRPAACRRPGHGGPRRPRPRTRLAAARPRGRARRRRSRARAGPCRVLGLRLANAPSVALRGVGRADTARRGAAGARSCPGGAAARGAAGNAARGGHRAARRRAGGAARGAPGRARGRGGRAGERGRPPRARACDLRARRRAAPRLASAALPATCCAAPIPSPRNAAPRASPTGHATSSAAPAPG